MEDTLAEVVYARAEHYLKTYVGSAGMTALPKSRGGCVILCELSPLQKTIYQAFLEHEDFELIATSQLICSCGSGDKQGYCCRVNNKGGKSWFQLVPSSTALLLKCANHLALVFPSPNRPGSQWISALFQRAFQKFPTLIGLSKAASLLTLSDSNYCGKIKVLHQMLVKMKQKCAKVLLCTHSSRLISALEEALLDLEFTYTKLDNRVPQEEREDALETFQREATKLVLLVLAVGDILPATLHCDYMIIFDPCLSTSNVSGDKTCPWCFTDFQPVYKLIALGTIEEVLHVRQASQMEGGSLHSEYGESSPAVFSYCEAFTLHSSPVSASLPDWKVTSKLVDGVTISQLTFLRNLSSDSGVEDTTLHSTVGNSCRVEGGMCASLCNIEWGTTKEPMSPVCTAQATCIPRTNRFDDASSESDDLGSNPAVMQTSAVPGTDGDVQLPVDKQKQRMKVTPKSLRSKGRIMQRKRKACRGLVYESDHDENAAIQKRAIAETKRKKHACALPKTQMAPISCKEPMEDGETLLDKEPGVKESLLQPCILVEPNLVHETLTEPFDAMKSPELFTPEGEKDAPLMTEQARSTVNMDELFGF